LTASNDFPKYKVAAIQASPIFLNKEATIEKACKLIGEASSHGAALCVFPETWVPGYPFWAGRVAHKFGDRTLKKVYARLYANSVDDSGHEVSKIGKAAKEGNIFVALGINERTPTGTFYNSILFFGSNGQLLGKHRKLVPTFNERMVWAHGDGSTLQVFDTEIGKISGLVCWEHWMPLARYTLYANGEQVHASLWPGLNETSLLACRTMAFEGRTFVVASGTYLTKDMLPDDLEIKDELADLPDVLFRGGSCIVGPDGSFIADPVYDCDTIVYADIDLARVYEEKQTLDVVGHYARPEVFTLHVNRKEMDPIVFSDGNDDT
jgi:nitrilase